MITTELNRLEYTGNADPVVFRDGVDIPIRDITHIKVYVTTTGVFTVDTDNDELDDDTHGHSLNQQITLSSATTMPTGLLSSTIYYVVNPTLESSNSFQVALSSSGTPVTISSVGSGTLTWTKTLLKAITTDYTVALVGTTATVTWASGKVPASTDKVLFLRDVTFAQNTDLQNNSQFEAESVETQLDLMVNMSQQLKNTSDRQLRLSNLLVAGDATVASATLTATSAERADKGLKFDTLGNLGVSTIDIDLAQDYILGAKSWSIEDGLVQSYSGTVASNDSSGEYSSKDYAVGDPPDGSSKEWATTDTVAITGGLYSSKQYAANSSTSATEAAASETAASASADAVAVMYDAFHDKFLGSMADGATQGTNPTPTGTWAKNSSTITVSSKTNIKVGQIVVGTGIETSPVPNVISIHPSASTIVISDNMAAAGSGVSLTFTGHGIYGTFDGSKDGPALNNDGDALTDGLLYFNTTDDVLKVYDLDDTLWRQTTPTSAQQTAIDTVSGISANVTTVAGISANVTTVAGISANTTTVAGISGNVTTVAGISANTTTVAGISSNVTTVAGISGNVTTVATNIANVNTTATNIAHVNNFADVYTISGSEPGSPNEGDLWFDTGTDVVKAYTGSAWIVATVSGTVPAAGGTFSGAVTFSAAVTLSSTINGTEIATFPAAGVNNTGIGIDALDSITTGDRNVALGDNALTACTEGANNSAVGYKALDTNITGEGNSSFGYYALQLNTANNNSSFGYFTLAVNSTGTQNSAFGNQALYWNSTGDENCAFGYSALFTNSTGDENSAFGWNALGLSTVSSNSAFGYDALSSNSTGIRNSAFGYSALKSNTTANGSTAVGYEALRNTTGYGNTAVGERIMLNNTTGTENVAVGHDCFMLNVSGKGNVAIGVAALAVSGNGLTEQGYTRNTAVGQGSLVQCTSGTHNTGLGAYAGSSVTTGSYNIYIGENVDGDATASNQLSIGDIIYGDLSTGDIWTKTTGKIKQKGAFMQSSTHQALTLGY